MQNLLDFISSKNKTNINSATENAAHMTYLCHK